MANRHTSTIRAAAAIALAILLSAAADRAAPYPRRVEIDGCENVFAVSPNVLSGGAPAGNRAFAALAHAGVRTIISVDGARPDVETAVKYGLRYVHAPIGYDGVPRRVTLTLARALNELPGTVYVHCHHGRHRSPAAVAALMVCTGDWQPEQAIDFMKAAGTAPDYTGLYHDVRRMRPASDEEVAGADGSFPSIAPVGNLVGRMVAMEHRLDALKRCQAAGWNSPPDHPDVVPVHEALQMVELFRESLRSPQIPDRPADYQIRMQAAESAATALCGALGQGDRGEADRALTSLEQTCTACHEKYRNKPQTP